MSAPTTTTPCALRRTAGPRAEELRQFLAHRLRVDRQRRIHQRDVAEQHALRVHRLILDPRHRQERGPLRMRVHHRVDVRPRAIDLGVDVIFERRTRGALDEVAREIDGDDVVHGQRAAHRRAGVDVEAAGVAPRAAVAVVVDIAGALEHPDRVDELLFHHDPALPELPRAADGREVDCVRLAAFLLVERGDRSAERGGLQLNPRAHLGEDRAEDRGLETRARRRRTRARAAAAPPCRRAPRRAPRPSPRR